MQSNFRGFYERILAEDFAAVGTLLDYFRDCPDEFTTHQVSRFSEEWGHLVTRPSEFQFRRFKLAIEALFWNHLFSFEESAARVRTDLATDRAETQARARGSGIEIGLDFDEDGEPATLQAGIVADMTARIDAAQAQAFRNGIMPGLSSRDLRYSPDLTLAPDGYTEVDPVNMPGLYRRDVPIVVGEVGSYSNGSNPRIDALPNPTTVRADREPWQHPPQLASWAQRRDFGYYLDSSIPAPAIGFEWVIIVIPADRDVPAQFQGWQLSEGEAEEAFAKRGAWSRYEAPLYYRGTDGRIAEYRLRF